MDGKEKKEHVYYSKYRILKRKFKKLEKDNFNYAESLFFINNKRCKLQQHRDFLISELESCNPSDFESDSSSEEIKTEKDIQFMCDSMFYQSESTFPFSLSAVGNSKFSIKKPKSPFMTFSRAYRKVIKKENPDAPESKISDLLRNRWKGLSEIDKMKYHEQYDQEKEKYVHLVNMQTIA